jgi:hypothetical protein
MWIDVGNHLALCIDDLPTADDQRLNVTLAP